MAAEAVLKGLKVAVLCTDMVERAELVEPWDALVVAGADVELVSDHPEPVQLCVRDDKADIFAVNHVLDRVSPSRYGALLLPGGVGNPDTLRLNPWAVAFVSHFFETRKPVAALSHAPWLLVEAGVAPGLTLTSWPSLRTDLLNAGATWLDAEVVIDRNLLTSRQPADLAAFDRELVDLFASVRV
jgi:protease I